jgi:hypothetical protein
VPKGTNLRKVESDLIHWAMTRINYCPGKCLGFKQPAVIFKKTCWLLEVESVTLRTQAYIRFKLMGLPAFLGVSSLLWAV